MAKTVQQELKELRRRVRQLEGSPSAEDKLPDLDPAHGTRASVGEPVEKQQREEVEDRIAD